MASACLNTIGLSPECSQKYSPYGWFSTRLSISLDESDTKHFDASRFKNCSDLPGVSNPVKEVSDLKDESDTTAFDGFEFRLEDPATMLPADELFSDGKLVPTQFSVNRPEVATSTTTILSGVDSRRSIDDVDPYVYSPRAPRCSSRWKELLGFRKLNQSSNNTGKVDNKRTTSLASSNATGATRSIRQLLYRNSKPSTDSSINLPLLKDIDNESASVSSRPSLSSSSSGHDIDDLPRLSLDSDKKFNMNMNSNASNLQKTKLVKTRTPTQSTDARSTSRVGRTLRRSTDATYTTNRCLSVDSPRINSSGKIIFHSLERSSSSPSSLIGGPKFKHRGMERSYSGNVRVTPVLNVPVCNLRGGSKSGGMFGLTMFSSQQKREVCSGSNNGGSNRIQRFNGKSRTDCC